MIVEVVSHLWAGQLSQYAKQACYHLTTFSAHPPENCIVMATICYSPDDDLAVKVVEYFYKMRYMNLRVGYRLKPMPSSKLWRRAIGRNEIAKETIADVVWFTDIDYLMLDNCLDRLCEIVTADNGKHDVFYPKTVHTHHKHSIGDRYCDEFGSDPRLAQVDRKDFFPRPMRKAIGGIQIVTGDVARRDGYLPNTRFQNPITDGKGFRSCKGDPVWRSQYDGSRKLGIDLPGVYRIRHTKNGRDEPIEAVASKS